MVEITEFGSWNPIHVRRLASSSPHPDIIAGELGISDHAEVFL
jgi:hypothetical protein